MEFDEEFFDAKAKALVFSLVESYGDGADRSEEMNLVIEDLDLTDDGFDMVYSLAGMAATFVVVLATSMGVDPAMLWHQIVGG